MDITEESLMRLIKKTKKEYSEEYYISAIPGFLSKKFIAYCSMKDDIRIMVEYINLLLNTPFSKIIKSSLTFSLISLYGKCFADATKNKFPKLEPDFIFKDFEEFRNTHDKLMELRHQFIAHRGKSASEVGMAFMLHPKTKEENPQVRFKRSKQISFGGDELLGINKLLGYIDSILDDKIQKNGDKVYKAYFELFNQKEISFMFINNLKDN